MSAQADPLARWWWPGQWLRIVYGVWVDQLWYRQTVRPRLRGRTEGWDAFAQAALGAALVSVPVAAPAVWAVKAVLPDAQVPLLLLVAGLGLLLAIGLGLLEGRRRSVAAGLGVCVAGAPVVAVVGTLIAAVHLGGGWDVLVGKSLAVTDSLGLPDPTPDEVVVTVEGGYGIYLPLVLR